MQSSDDEIEEFEVEILKKSGGGLGITIAGLVKTDTGGMYSTCTRTCIYIKACILFHNTYMYVIVHSWLHTV